MPGPLDNVQLFRVDNLATLDACRRWAGERRETPLFADTESSGLSPHRDKMRMVQLGDMRAGWAFPPGWWGAAIELLLGYAGLVGFHNSPYDQRVLKVHEGVMVGWERVEDTLLLGHIADSLRLAGLKPRSAQEIDPRAIAAEQQMLEGMKARHWTYADTPDSWAPYWMYAALDPVLAAWLWWKFRPARTAYRQAYDLERATARICTNMMLAGMRIDIPYIKDRMSEIGAYTSQAGGWLRGQYGIGNANSNNQVVAAMEKAEIPVTVFTEKGNPCLNKEALNYYRLTYPEFEPLFNAIRWCRKGDSLINSYLGKFLTLASGDTLYYNIHSCRARTTRMSVTDPPMQTFDRDIPYVRGSFIPREGHVFVTIDADQIEARLTAHFANDPRMIADFRYCDEHHLKFFIEMASRIYAERVAKSDPRYTMTKNATYGQIYGAGLAKAAVTAGVPVEIMRPAYEGLDQMYPNVRHYMNFLIRSAQGKRPKVQTIDGRYLYCYRGHEYALLNTLIQACAATILKQGIINLDAGGLGEFLRLPVHDEVLMEVPVSMAQDVLTEAERILTDHETYRVPITWSGSILEKRWVKS